MKNNPLLKKLNLRYLVSLLISIVLAFIIGAGILALSGFSPLKAYGAMLSGAFDSARHVGDFLEYAMVLCICGLACVLGARVGIFNVGGEGQLLLGAIFACQVGVWLDGLSPWIVIPAAALAAMIVGGFYAFIPGILKVKVKVNEVITTIMLNTIAAYLCQYLAKGPWKNANKNMVAATEQLNAQYWFGNVIPRSSLSTAIFAAAIIAFIVWYVMQKTSRGFEMRLTGQNPRFARFSGIRTDRLVILCMVISGAMCGLVGMFRVYGAEHLYRDSVSRDYYFEALMVAMIAQYKPGDGDFPVPVLRRAEDRGPGHGADRRPLSDLSDHSDRDYLLHGGRERHLRLSPGLRPEAQGKARRQSPSERRCAAWMIF